jgi:competence protein ComEA
VEVAGKVDRPGVYVFPQPPTLSQVLAQAGGAGPADKGETTLASGAKVEVGDAGRWGLGRMGGAQLLALGLALDLNRAGAEDLDALPGIGPALAQRIIAYRQDRGPFKKVDDLEKVSGIGPKKLEQLRAYVVVEDEINEK